MGDDVTDKLSSGLGLIVWWNAATDNKVFRIDMNCSKYFCMAGMVMVACSITHLTMEQGQIMA